MNKPKRIVFIFLSILVLIAAIFVIYYLDILNGIDINWQASILDLAFRLMILIGFSVLPFLAINSIILNFILLLKKEVLREKTIEDNLLGKQDFSQFSILDLSNLFNVFFGSLLIFFTISIFFAFFRDLPSTIKTEDVLILTAFSISGIFGIFVLLDSLAISKKIAE